MTFSQECAFMWLPMLCNASMWLGWRAVVIVSSKCAARCLTKCCSHCGTITTCLHLVLFVSSLRRTHCLPSNFVYFTQLYSLRSIGIGYWMSSPLVFDFYLTMEGGKGERALLQHRLLHRIFWTILCTAIYSTALCLPLRVSLDCSVDGVSPPSGAILNRRPIL